MQTGTPAHVLSSPSAGLEHQGTAKSKRVCKHMRSHFSTQSLRGSSGLQRSCLDRSSGDRWCGGARLEPAGRQTWGRVGPELSVRPAQHLKTPRHQEVASLAKSCEYIRSDQISHRFQCRPLFSTTPPCGNFGWFVHDPGTPHIGTRPLA